MTKKICVVNAAGKLGSYIIAHALARNYEVNAVCREQSVPKLDAVASRINIFPVQSTATDRNIMQQAMHNVDAVITVLVPFGRSGLATNTAQNVLDFAPNARQIFSCGWHISKDKQDKQKRSVNMLVSFAKVVGYVTGMLDIEDQVRACDLVFASTSRWTVVRGSGLEEGPSEGLPVWSTHAHDKCLQSDLMRRTDFALFMVHAVEDESLIGKAPALVGCKSDSALAYPPDHSG
mmetsp:Transcript_8046/g.22168  ORF Transcript_8046/g.22168 Transcript_8046/m.22168 type:complete len:234 (+) Transcript_8046:61-762(+)|eukprot:CAMPEP_0185201970 /NCGR_PEP_ID=MMETSP1140-20130426/50233_1 /TAXON_ID=298111 /ORGANISM="Pavlova sp., Strain CCMP459" /LENGTH=233 /DNA_ID=CAMNT_0027769383 /DNA_START=43 /DNA_END=744 /DNA_ORIENTATION=-